MKIVYAGSLLIGGVLALTTYRPGIRVEPSPQPVLRAATPSAPVTLSSFEQQLVIADSAYWAGEHELARNIWRELRAEATDSSLIADIETSLGLASWRLGDYAAARRHGETALQLKQRLGLNRSLPKSYNALGLLAWNEGRLGDALALFREGLKVAPFSDDRAIAGKLASNIGLIEVEFARFDASRAGFEEALRIARANGEARLEGNALSNLAMLDVRVDDPASAIPRLLVARQVYAHAEYPTGEQNALVQLATAYTSLGDVQRAFAALDSAEVLAMRHGLRREAAVNLELKGDLYRDAGDVPKALQHYERAQAVNKELGLEVERGTLLRKSAAAQATLGLKAAARAKALAAVAIHQQTGASLEEFKDRVLLADQDDRELAGARELARIIGTPGVRADLALAEARGAVQQSAFERALSSLRRDSIDIGNAGFEIEAEAASLRAAALAGTDRELDAAAAVRASIDALERARLSIGSSLLRASFVAYRAPLYTRLINVELLLNRPREAFGIAELARERLSGQIVLGDQRNERATNGLRRVRELTANVNQLTESVAGGDEAMKPTLDMLRRELADARVEYENVIARSQWRVGLTGGTDVDAIAASLRDGEALLEYFVGGEDVFAFVVTRKAFRATRLSVSATELSSRVRIARSTLAAPRSSSDVFVVLHRDLVQPFTRELHATNRLIVVPHASLTYLPFAALRETSERPPLIETHTIQYLPAASELPRLRSMPMVAGRPRAVILEPFPKQLPGTHAEALAVRRSWRKAQLLKRQAASAGALRLALNGPGPVHVSSHAAMDAQTPLFSYVSVAQQGGRGRFEIHDVFASRVRSPLVYLSGCETGLGSASSTGYETGADASTFARAFLAAGARGVVSTLWRIEDQSAARLAGSFYRHLQKGDAADALARAQRELLRSKTYGDAYYWAPYILTGEVRFAN